MREEFNKKNIYGGIDIFRIVAAILVVILHTVETTDWYPNEVKFVFTRMAVPFFFITSGFFFNKGLDGASNQREFFIRYEKKLLKLFAVWAIIIYFPFEVVSYTTKYPDAGILKMGLYFFRRVFIIGPGPYWYLVSLMWSAAFLYLCNIKKKEILISVGIVLGLTLEIMYACFRGYLGNFTIFKCLFQAVYFVYSWEFNFFMFGIPFMGIGYCIAKKDWSLSPKVACTILVLSTAVRVFEYNLPRIIQSSFWNDNNLSFAFVFQAVSFFMLAKDIDIKISEETSKALRQLSSCIYFSHAIFLYEILNPLLNKFTELPIYEWEFILPKVIVVLMLCCGLYLSVRKINNKHLNILING